MSATMLWFWEQQQKEKAYKELRENRTGIFGIDKSLKPRHNLIDGTIEITTPDKRREVYKRENTFFGTKYKRVK